MPPESGGFFSKLLAKFSDYTNSQVATLSDNQTLSDLVQQKTAATAPLPAGIANLINDPYAGKPVPANQLPDKTLAPGDPFHLNSDIAKQQKLNPDGTTSKSSQPLPQAAPGTYASCAGSNTFASPGQSYCEMGDYLYYKNGTIWNKRTGKLQ